MRNAWKMPTVTEKSAMLVLYHHRMPNWLWKLLGDIEIVSKVLVKFEGMEISSQVHVAQKARGLISVEGFVWQIFLDPRSPLLMFALSKAAMNPQRKTTPVNLCTETPSACHDVWATHLGHSMLTWRWCDKRPFHSLTNTSKAMLERALTLLLNENGRAKTHQQTWICYIMRSLAKDVYNFTPSCDIEIEIAKHEVDRFQEQSNNQCGVFGEVGPSLLYSTLSVPPHTVGCTVSEVISKGKNNAGNCKRYQKWPAL